MKSLAQILLLPLSMYLSGCGFIKPRIFNNDQEIPRTARSYTMDSTYRLYIREICRADNATRCRINGQSIVRNECHLLDTPNVLVERQYLYYSPVRRNVVFIMLIPNYPVYHNGAPTFNMPQIRNPPVVNVWNANCFLFGRMSASADTIYFKKWKSTDHDKWVVHLDANEESIEILGANDPEESDQINRVADNLAVNVVYRLAPSVYPMRVDGTMFRHHDAPHDLKQVFYYEEMKKDKYGFYIPYEDCPDSVARCGMRFNGIKGRNSRLPYDISSFFTVPDPAHDQKD